ncbi:MAG: helix-turn-helix transcriptional regulator [Phormidesmis sp.]
MGAQATSSTSSSSKWPDWLLPGSPSDSRLLHSDASDLVWVCPDHIGQGYVQEIFLQDDLSLFILAYTLHASVIVTTARQSDRLEFEFQLAGKSPGYSFFEPHLGLKNIGVKPGQRRCFKVEVILKRPTLTTYFQAYIERLLPQAQDVAKRVMQSMYQYLNSGLAIAPTAETIDQLLQSIPASGYGNFLANSVIEQILPAPLYAETVVFNYANRRPITPKMKQLLGHVLSCPYQGVTRRQYLKRLALELVTLRLAATVQLPLPQDDLDCVEQATAILRNQLAHPPTIESLARQVYTNRLKLNQSFHRVYGTTPFNYLRECRLTRAHYLLMTSDLSVSEVAIAVGYTCRSKFATAFRQWRGINPKAYQMQALRQAS